MILGADSDGSDQTAHPRSLNRAFAVNVCQEGTVLLGAT